MDASVKYSGLCIAGPLAGQHKAVPTSTLWAEPRSPEVARLYQPVPEPIPFEPLPEPFKYQHVSHHYVSDGAGKPEEVILGFWVPADERNPRRFVVEELARFYAEAHGHAL